MSQNYFFALIPHHLKPDHSFAKTIKPNTKYRLVLYKGIQKCDEMKQSIKSKLVGGKIDLQSPELFFSVQFYSPLKNIQFTLKLYEEKPGEEETEIGSVVIMSGDYIKKYKNGQGTVYLVEGRFKEDLGVAFQIVVEKSKYALTDAMKKTSGMTGSKQVKEIVDENRSQSSKSKQLIRQGDGFISPRKRIERKSGHKGKLRSRNNSRQDGDISSEGSVASSRRRWRKSPPSKEGEHFMHSPKKASPPKINEPQKGKSVTKSQASVKSGDQKVKTKPQINQKSYNYKPADNLKFQNTKEIFDIKVDRNSSPVQSPVHSQKQNIVEKPSVAKSTIISQPAKPSGIQSPTPSQSALRQATSPVNHPTPPKTLSYQSVSPRSTNTQPVQTNNSSVKQPITSPKSSKNTFVDLEVKHTPQMFDVVQKRSYPSPTQKSQTYQYQPPKGLKGTSPKAENLEADKIIGKSPQKAEQASGPLEKQASRNQLKKVLHQDQQSVNLKRTDSVEIQNPADIKVGNSRTNLQVSSQKGTTQQSKVNIKMEGSIHEPELVLISRDDKSQKTDKSIDVKQKAVKKEKGQVNKSGPLKGSSVLKEAEGHKKKDEQTMNAEKAAQQQKQLILYIIFLIVSMFLIYQAMSPTRRV